MKRKFLLMFFFMLFFPLSVFSQGTPLEVEMPLGLDKDLYLIPEDNPMTEEKVKLGELLYFDPRLSSDDTVSCATCHAPDKGFTDQEPVSTGINNQKGARNAPTVINSTFNYFQFWDGRAPSLEEQAKGPIANPIEMTHIKDEAKAHQVAMEKIAVIQGYKPYFKAAFGDEKVTLDRVAKAIAAYERTVLSGNSAWDKYVYNKDESALSESAKRGLKLFEGKANCTRCHVGFNLSDSLFHNLGVGMDKKDPDLGRYDVTQQEKDKGAFKTPILRDLLKTAPYMHDGSQKTLEEVVEFYDVGGEPNPWLDPKMEPLNLTAQEKADLVEFMKSLEGDWTPPKPPVLPE